jgi:hypothetical protein
MDAAREGHLETAKVLLKNGARPNARQDMTRLRYWRASFVGDRTTTARIQKSGQLPQRREDGPSVLDWASEHPEIVVLLKQAGAKR